jgi:hypothetical protein
VSNAVHRNGNLRIRTFLKVLKKIMLKSRETIDFLFEAGQAAPETAAFLGR